MVGVVLVPGDGTSQTSVEGFRSSAHNAAKRMGVPLETVVKEDGVYLQAIWPDEEDEDPTIVNSYPKGPAPE